MHPTGSRGPARLRRAAAVLVTTLLLNLAIAPSATAGGEDVYLRADAPIAARVHDLLRRMTVNEKVGQLEQIALTRLQGDCTWSGGALNETCLGQVFADEQTGSILSGGGMAPQSNTPRDWAFMINTIQRFAIEHSRLRIPIVYGADAVHGHNNVLGATIFPHQIGIGATWDPAIAGAAARSTHRAVAATGVTWNFAPVADLARDQRWGRYYETFAEDPVLDGMLAADAVRGFQEGGRVAATVKHFGGYSEPANGHDRVPADLSMRYLQDTILPSYKAAVDAGALTVMANSGAVNGIPVTGSHYLLTDVLRGQWHFAGLVISDWNDVRNLQTAYHVATDYPEAIAMAINAGVDMAMVPPDDRSFHAAALDAVNRRLISRTRLDEAVGRVLALKFRLGLFEHPYVDPDRADAAVLGVDKDLARRTATESLVLLRNANGVLPFGAGTHRIVVTGPSADSIPNQTGGWTIGWQGIPDGVTVPGTTILQGLRAGAPAGTDVVSAPDPAGLLMAWLPGTEGGNAVADVLYGRANPSGRLPVSWPKALGNEPVYYQQLPGTNGGPDSGYSPLFAFGAGLSYTGYTIGNLTVDRPAVRPGDPVGLTVTVANTGSRAGDLVVPVYASQPVSTVLVPPKRLVAFTRVALDAGQTRTVHLSFPASRLAVTPGDVNGAGTPRVQPGPYVLVAGDSTAPFTVH